MREKFFVLHRCLFDELTISERFVLSYIETFSRNGEYTSASTEYIAGRMQMGISSVKKAIVSLEKIGLISVTRHKAQKSDKWSRKRNEYRIVKSSIDTRLTAWKKQNSMPDKVIIPESALLVFGHTVQCIFACVLDSIQKTADRKPDHEYLHGVICYSHSQFAQMCGCSKRTISDTLKEFEKAGYIELESSAFGYKKAQYSYVFHMPDSGKNDTSHGGKNDTSHSGKNDTSTDSFQQEKDEKNDDLCKNDAEKNESGKNDTSRVEKKELVTVEKIGCKEYTSYINPMTGFMSGASQAMPQAPEVIEKSGSENSGINESLLLDRIAENPEVINTEMRRQKALESLASIPD